MKSNFKAKLVKWKGAKKKTATPIKSQKLPKGKGKAEDLKKPGNKSGYKTEAAKKPVGLKDPKKAEQKKTEKKQVSENNSINSNMDKFNSLITRLDEEFAKELDAQQDLSTLVDDEGLEDEGTEGTEAVEITVTLTPEQVSVLREILAQVDVDGGAEHEGDETPDEEAAEHEGDEFGGAEEAEETVDEDEEECMKPVAKVQQGKAILQKSTTVKPLGNQGLKKEAQKLTTPVKAPTQFKK